MGSKGKSSESIQESISCINSYKLKQSLHFLRTGRSAVDMPGVSIYTGRTGCSVITRTYVMDHVLLPMLHLFNDGYLAAMPLFLPFLTEMFGITLGQVGFLGSLLNFSGIFLALPAGLAAARYGATKILNYAVLLLCLAFLVLGFSSGFPVIVCAFVLASVAFGIFHPIAFAAVARQGQDGSLGRRLGTFAATGDIGRIGFAATVTLLIAYSSWRTVSFLYAAMAAIVFSVCLAARRCTRGTVAGMEGKKRTLDMSLFRNHRFLLSTVASVMDSFANSSLFIFLPFLLTYRGIDVALMGAFTGVLFVNPLLHSVGKLLAKY